jgi:ABC-type glycerol-3-phosphate transport system substrate-binding protein
VPVAVWAALTGEQPPRTPADRDTYAAHGYPWFAIYDEPLGDVPVDPRWATVKTVQALTGLDRPGAIRSTSW